LAEARARELREYADRRGRTLSGEYVDIGIYGTKETRPELDRLMPATLRVCKSCCRL